MGGMMSQNVLNLVDIGMVGRLGDVALAATGIGSFANYLALAFIIGLSAGVQALAARRLGEGRTSETAVPLNGGLILALIIGILTCALLVWPRRSPSTSHRRPGRARTRRALLRSARAQHDRGGHELRSAATGARST
jgi:hypothetical protein